MSGARAPVRGTRNRTSKTSGRQRPFPGKTRTFTRGAIPTAESNARNARRAATSSGFPERRLPCEQSRIFDFTLCKTKCACKNAVNKNREQKGAFSSLSFTKPPPRFRRRLTPRCGATQSPTDSCDECQRRRPRPGRRGVPRGERAQGDPERDEGRGQGEEDDALEDGACAARD